MGTLRSDKWLPVILQLGENLERGIPLLSTLEQRGSHDVCVASNSLVVVDMRGAVGTIVAVHGVA